MWLINILPDWIFYLFLVLSTITLIVGTVLKSQTTQIASVLIIIVCIWFAGGISNEAKWKERVAELEAKVAIAEVKSAEVNTKVVTKTVTKIKKVKEVVYVNKEIIREVVAKQIDLQCTIPVSAISVHNSASQNEISRGTSSTDGAPSNVKASTLLGTVAENYGTYYEITEKLKGWQTWYTDQKKVFEESQK